MTVGDRIRQTREDKDITQTKLAQMIGLSDKSSISKIEKSGDDVSLKNIERIAEALNVTPSYLMGWNDMPNQLSIYDLDENYQITNESINENFERMYYNKSFYKINPVKLENEIKKKKMTIEEFADKLGWMELYVREILSSNSYPINQDDINKICSVLGIDSDAIFDRTYTLADAKNIVIELDINDIKELITYAQGILDYKSRKKQ